MDWSRNASLLMTLILAISRISMGVVHKVGDSAGWTVIGNADFYSKWASARAFRLGDTILFEYDPEAHSVLQVSRSNFHDCNTTSPVATYSTGNDSIPLKNIGHYYYVCGFPGHCQAGQKVDIRVPKNTTQTVSFIPGPGEATIQFSPGDSPPNVGGLVPPRAAGGLVNSAPSLISSGWLSLLFLGLYVRWICFC